MLLIVAGLLILGQAAKDRAGLHIVAVDDEVITLSIGTQRCVFVKVRHAVDAVALVKVVTKIEILIVWRVHNREIQLCAINREPPDEIAVLIAQGGKLGPVGVGALPGRLRRGSCVDHRLQLGKLVFCPAVIRKALDKQPGTDQKNNAEKEHGQRVGKAAALFLGASRCSRGKVCIVVLIVKGCVGRGGRLLRRKVAATDFCHSDSPCLNVKSRFTIRCSRRKCKRIRAKNQPQNCKAR